MKKILNFKYITAVLAVVLILIRLVYSFLIKPGGDELFFIEEFDFIRDMGWFNATLEGICVPFSIVSIPFGLFFDTHTALRLSSLAINIVALVYVYIRLSNDKRVFYFFLIFTSLVDYFFVGTNDALFTWTLAIFFIEIFLAITKKDDSKVSLIFSLLVLAIFTRMIFIVYLPSIFLGLYFLYKNQLIKARHLTAPFILLSLFLFLNSHSISQKGKLSYEIKESSNKDVTWTEYQYLSQLSINEGKIPENHWVKWDEVVQYKIENGENSLPKTTKEAIFFDLKLTIVEFFKDSVFAMLKLTRNLFFILFIISFYFLWNIRYILKEKEKFFIPFIFFVSLFTLALIIINNLETRWLGVVVLPCIFYYFHIVLKENILIGRINIIKVFNNLNNLGLIFFSLYGLYRLYGFYLMYS